MAGTKRPTNTTFSVRLRPADHGALSRYASMRRVSVAEQAREFVLEGLFRALNDTAAIEQEFETEKQRMLAYVKEIRAAVKGPEAAAEDFDGTPE